jgi:hypothetical protein
MWRILLLMPDDFEMFGDPPPSEAEPQHGAQQDSLLMKWLLAMTPEQRLRSHDGALEWFLAVRSGRIKLYGAMDITAPPKNITFNWNTSTGI